VIVVTGDAKLASTNPAGHPGSRLVLIEYDCRWGRVTVLALDIIDRVGSSRILELAYIVLIQMILLLMVDD
jgi:hypothetical protein